MLLYNYQVLSPFHSLILTFLQDDDPTHSFRRCSFYRYRPSILRYCQSSEQLRTQSVLVCKISLFSSLTPSLLSTLIGTIKGVVAFRTVDFRPLLHLLTKRDAPTTVQVGTGILIRGAVFLANPLLPRLLAAMAITGMMITTVAAPRRAKITNSGQFYLWLPVALFIQDRSRYPSRTCCLPNGGPPSSPGPPPGKQCPGNNWYWHQGLGCCAPNHPNPPPPTCNNNWSWDGDNFCCNPPPPKPSGHSKRSLTSRTVSLCPAGLQACPIPGIVASGDYECIDTDAELESCGGCASIGEGQDCTAIAGAWNVGCENGTCAGQYT